MCAWSGGGRGGGDGSVWCRWVTKGMLKKNSIFCTEYSGYGLDLCGYLPT